MIKRIIVLLFVALPLSISVNATATNGIYNDECAVKESVTVPDFTGDYVMFFSSSLITDLLHYVGFSYMKYYLSEDTYVNVSIEKDSIDENKYIIKHFGGISSINSGRVFDLTASYNPETGKLEIPRQPFLPSIDHLHSPCDLVNVQDHNAPITISIQSGGNLVIDEWAAIYNDDAQDGDYYYKGKNAVLMRPNAIMEWTNLQGTDPKQVRAYVKVEQDSNSPELAIANFCNRGKRIVVNLQNDTTFMIPVQLVYHFEDWIYYDGEWMEAPLFSHYCYLSSGYDESYHEIPITGKWTSTTLVSDTDFWYGNESLSCGHESNLTLTMLSGQIISPFASNVTGDVNGDGKVNVSDVTTLVNMILGLISKDEARADVDGNGKVNVSDVTALINIILGIQ